MGPILPTTSFDYLKKAAHAAEDLRDAIDQSLGSVFFGPLLRSARNSSLKGTIGHGGHGEDVFRGQLDQILVERAGTASHHELGEALFQRFAAVAVKLKTGAPA